jgi:hypothetical protein
MVIKSRLRLAGHAEYVDMRNAYKVLVWKPEGERPLRTIIIKQILNKWRMSMWSGFMWLR